MASIRFPKISAVLILLLFSSVFFGAFRRMDDPDIWFQLLAGRYFLIHGAAPHSDFFIYAGRGAPQIFGGWGFGALYELAMRALGPAGSTLLNAAIWWGAFFCAAKAASLRARACLAALPSQTCLAFCVAASALCVCMAPRMNMRAESTLFLAWTASLWLFECARSRPTLRLFWIGMPLIAWAEAWLHTSGFMLLAIIPIAAARRAQDQGPSFWSAKNMAPWALCLAAAILLPTLNPNGAAQPYIQLRAIMDLFAATPSGGSHFKNLEYLPAWDRALATLRPYFCLLFMLLAIVWARRPTLASVVEGLVALAFFSMALLHARGIGMAAMPIMIPLFAQILALPASRFRLGRRPAVAFAFLFACAPVGIAYCGDRLGIQEENSLGEAAAFIKTHSPHGAHIFTVETGPQLAYALLDERYLIASAGHLLIPNPAVAGHIERMVNGLGDWAAELDRERVDFVCLPLYVSHPDQGIYYPLPMLLSIRPDWKLHPIAGPCSLFSRLPSSQQLTAAEVEDQTLLYLQNVQALASLNAFSPSHPDKVGALLIQGAQQRIDEIQKKRKRPASAAFPPPSNH